MSITNKDKVIYILILLSFIIPIITSFGTVDSFMFLHIATSMNIDRSGHIPGADPNFFNLPPSMPGFYTLMVEIANVCNIPYDKLSFLPINLIPFILLFFAVFNFFCSDRLITSLLVFISAIFSHILFPMHQLGIILLLCIVLFIIKLYNVKDVKTSGYFSVMMIAIIIALNFISYKMTFVAIVFVLLMILVDFLNAQKKVYRTLLYVFFIASAMTIMFNQFIYSTFLPVLMSVDYSTLDVMMLIDLVIHNYGFDSSAFLFYSTPVYFNYIKMIRLAAIFLLTIFFLAYLFRARIIKGVRLQLHEELFIVMLACGIANFIVYNMIGYFDTTIITYSMFLPLLILYENFKKIRTVVIGVILILLVSSILYQAIILQDAGIQQKDDTFFSYIGPSYQWLADHSNKNIKTDVLTQGYYQMESANNYSTITPSVFLYEDVLGLINKNDTKQFNTMYIVNYNENYIELYYWKVLRSFKNFAEDIDNNKNFNKLYDHRDMAIYT